MVKLPLLRARAKITSHFGISSSSHFLQILKSKNLEIVHYYGTFCSLQSTNPNLNLSAKKVNLFLRKPLENGNDLLDASKIDPKYSILFTLRERRFHRIYFVIKRLR